VIHKIVGVWACHTSNILPELLDLVLNDPDFCAVFTACNNPKGFRRRC
jgi:hypothetical protein